VRDLTRRFSEKHRLWGTERIRGELLKLGIAVGNGSIRRYPAATHLDRWERLSGATDLGAASTNTKGSREA
jgi:hypothetical protein